MSPRPSPEELVAERIRLARVRAAQVAHTDGRPVLIPAQRRPVHVPGPRVPFVMPPSQSAPHRHITPQRRPVDIAGRPAPWPRTFPLPISYPVDRPARRRRARAVRSAIVVAGCLMATLVIVLVGFGVLMSP